MDKKCLVAYYSATGITKRVAKSLVAAANADLYEIEAKMPYFSSDLNWKDKDSRCTKEWQDNTIRPEIKAPVADMIQYDVIFVGYPIWWEQAPNIIFTFLESYDFSGKTIIPFSTSAGSIKGSEGKHLHGYCSQQTAWKTGKLWPKNASEEAMSAWLKDLSL